MEDSDEMPRVHEDAINEFYEKRDEIITNAKNRSFETHKDSYSSEFDAKNKIANGFEFITKMLEAAISTGKIILLEDQLIWAMDRLPHDGVKPHQILQDLKFYKEAIDEQLSSSSATQISAYLSWMIEKQQSIMNGMH